MNIIRKTSVLAALLLTIASGACAASTVSVSIDGKVAADNSVEIYAPIGGQVDKVSVKAGQNVKEGDSLVTLRTSKVYASVDGTIRGIFGQAGDLVSSVTSRYSAVMYIETDALYTCSASTEYAYSSTETKTIHIGETVYLKSTEKNTRTGVGLVTAVNGTKFEVEVQSGEFLTGEKAYVYRDEAMSLKKKLGKGEVTRKSSVAVNASSVTSTSTSSQQQSNYSIARICVEDGQHVNRGDLLMELLTGDFDGLYMSGADITSTVTGTVATITPSQGDSVTKNSVVATVYTRDSMVVEAELPEDNLKDIHEGDSVTIKLATDESKSYEGTVRMISGVATSSTSTSSEVTFTTWIDFEPDDNVRYGTSVIVETKD